MADLQMKKSPDVADKVVLAVCHRLSIDNSQFQTLDAYDGLPPKVTKLTGWLTGGAMSGRPPEHQTSVAFW